MNLLIVTVVAATLLGISSAAAGSYSFLLRNVASLDVTRLTVKDGKVQGFKRLPKGGERSVTITLPDGVCRSRIRITFANNTHIDNTSYDICSEDGLTVIGP